MDYDQKQVNLMKPNFQYISRKEAQYQCSEFLTDGTPAYFWRGEGELCVAPTVREVVDMWKGPPTDEPTIYVIQEEVTQ